jgi:hypothetical protein
MSEAAMLQSIARDLYTAVLSDVLDELGYRDQAMPPSIRPLDDELVMVGRARTGVYREVYSVVPGANPYALEIALVDDLKAGDVAVLGCGGSTRIAPWGELLSTGGARTRRGRLPHRRLRARHQADSPHKISRIPRGNRAARFEGSRHGRGDRRAHPVRRRCRVAG